MDNALAAASRGLSSPAAHGASDPRHRWYRVVARRLAEAIRGRSQEDVLAAAALAAAVVEQERDGTCAARRGVNLLDVAQIAPGSSLAPDVRALLEQGAEDLLHATSGTPAAVAERLRHVLHEVAARKRAVPSRLVLREIPSFVAEHLHEGISLTGSGAAPRLQPEPLLDARAPHDRRALQRPATADAARARDRSPAQRDVGQGGRSGSGFLGAGVLQQGIRAALRRAAEPLARSAGLTASDGRLTARQTRGAQRTRSAPSGRN